MTNHDTSVTERRNNTTNNLQFNIFSATRLVHSRDLKSKNSNKVFNKKE